ncbi:thiamine-binding protein [Flavobacteriaceae bacterium]|nr:thiamine-binding protein [Flavobacteriaceae bacterium]MDA9970811.1 thiamine-binding protein [Flavobacteriaceae bacterium]MDB9874162.1 thiamine-binding protein [Flavobacteriaceae bacterium]MDB9954664.1 thiamine-binding protein [Flavobacteriaceae bacterium]MDC1266248.1 thiamine-binding protein [Flavobacteriaceae bacterium]
MNISVEFTLMPLQTDFEPPIIDFIKTLRASEFKVLENPLSTQIYGEYDALMLFLTATIKASFDEIENVVLNMKIVKSDRSDYEPHF